MLNRLQFSIDLYTDGEKFFSILKAFIRDYKGSQWPHEIERKVFAQKLFEEALNTFEEGILSAEARINEGFQTERDLQMVRQMKEKCEYWKEKYRELTDDLKV